MNTAVGDESAITGWAAAAAPAFEPVELLGAIRRVRETAAVVTDPATSRIGVSVDGNLTGAHEPGAWPVTAVLPPLYPEWLGDRSFNESHNTRFPYVTGAMANGIATTQLVIEAARAGCLGFFGAGGLGFERVREIGRASCRERV